MLRRELVLDAHPEPACDGYSAPFGLDLGAVTALTQLELRGYATKGPPNRMQRLAPWHVPELQNTETPGERQL